MFHSFTLNTSVIQTDGQTDRQKIYIYIYIYIYILATVKTTVQRFQCLICSRLVMYAVARHGQTSTYMTAINAVTLAAAVMSPMWLVRACVQHSLCAPPNIYKTLHSSVRSPPGARSVGRLHDARRLFSPAINNPRSTHFTRQQEIFNYSGPSVRLRAGRISKTDINYNYSTRGDPQLRQNYNHERSLAWWPPGRSPSMPVCRSMFYPAVCKWRWRLDSSLLDARLVIPRSASTNNINQLFSLYGHWVRFGTSGEVCGYSVSVRRLRDWTGTSSFLRVEGQRSG